MTDKIIKILNADADAKRFKARYEAAMQLAGLNEEEKQEARLLMMMIIIQNNQEVKEIMAEQLFNEA